MLAQKKFFLLYLFTYEKLAADWANLLPRQSPTIATPFRRRHWSLRCLVRLRPRLSRCRRRHSPARKHFARRFRPLRMELYGSRVRHSVCRRRGSESSQVSRSLREVVVDDVIVLYIAYWAVRGRRVEQAKGQWFSVLVVVVVAKCIQLPPANLLPAPELLAGKHTGKWLDTCVLSYLCTSVFLSLRRSTAKTHRCASFRAIRATGFAFSSLSLSLSRFHVFASGAF